MWKTCIDCGKTFQIEADEFLEKCCLPSWKCWKACHEGACEVGKKALALDPQLEQVTKRMLLLQCDEPARWRNPFPVLQDRTSVETVILFWDTLEKGEFPYTAEDIGREQAGKGCA